MFPKIMQLLPTIYRSFQPNSKTLICTKRKGMHQEMGMGRHETTSIQQIEYKTHHCTSSDLLRAPRTNQDRNRLFKICRLRDTIITVQDRKSRPVAYQSKTMADPECNYDIHNEELWRIVQALHEWKCSIRGSPKPVRVLTKYKNLVTFMTMKELSELQAR